MVVSRVSKGGPYLVRVLRLLMLRQLRLMRRRYMIAKAGLRGRKLLRVAIVALLGWRLRTATVIRQT